MKKVKKCGIISAEKFKERAIQIAKGEYKPKPEEPKIWFESLNTLAQTLNPVTIELLRLIDRERPESITELAKISGRTKGNLSRTLKRLQHYGIVKLEKNGGRLKPITYATDFQVDFGVYTSFIESPTSSVA